MNKVLYYVVTRLKFLFCNLVSWRCLFSRLDFLIRKVGAGCRSEPKVQILKAIIGKLLMPFSKSLDPPTI